MGVLSLIAKLGLDASGFRAGLKQSQSAADKFGKNVGGSLKNQLAAAFGTAAFVSAAKSMSDYAGRIDDLSQKLGVSRGALQEWDYAASQNSATLDQVTKSLEKLSVAREAALKQPAGEQSNAFREMGIAADQLRTARLEDLLKAIATSVKSASDPQQKMASGIKLLGEEGSKLFPAMRSGFDEAAERARNMGVVIRDDAILSVRKLGDQITDMKFRARSAFFALEPLFSLIGKTATQIEVGLAFASGFLGSMSYSPSMSQAFDAAIAASNEVFNRDAGFSSDAVKNQLTTEGLLGSGPSATYSATTAASKTATKGPGLGFSANSLQQIGAYVGQNPILFESKQQTKVLLKVSKTLEQIERAQRLTGGGFLA
jgi:hypothetical protein